MDGRGRKWRGGAIIEGRGDNRRGWVRGKMRGLGEGNKAVLKNLQVSTCRSAELTDPSFTCL